MSYYVEMPRYGANMEEGTVGEWLVQDGSPVQKGDPICTIEIEKLTNELLAEEEGVLKHILQEGDTAACGDVIASVSTEGEELPALTGSHEPEVAVTPSPAMPAEDKKPAAGSEADVMNLTPKALKLWEEIGKPDLTGISGTGYGGKVTRDDLRSCCTNSVPSESEIISSRIQETNLPRPSVSAEYRPTGTEMVFIKSIPMAQFRIEDIAAAVLSGLEKVPSMRVFQNTDVRDMSKDSILWTVVDSADGERAFPMTYSEVGLEDYSLRWKEKMDRASAGLESSVSLTPPGAMVFYDASQYGLDIFKPGLSGFNGPSVTVGSPGNRINIQDGSFSSVREVSICLTVDSSLVSRSAALQFLNYLESSFQ
ncbi:MAG: hypothetical protein PQJ58_21015 [Spirochaetales bacterium]|nr:hypothetical protein [Spirochaetales bacterium]